MREFGDLLGPGSWSIVPAGGAGSAGRTWLADDGRRRLFVKQGVNAELLRALAAIDVAPQVIAARDDVVAQEFVVGVTPTPSWIDANMIEVVSFVERYQDSAAVTPAVPALSSAEYVDRLSERAASADADAVRTALEIIVRRLPDADTAPPILTHGDPNASNMLIRPDGRMCVVDWDEARVADPMRDLGPLLWWYVRPTRWRAALEAAGLRYERADGAVTWWAAARSVEVSLWLQDQDEPDAAWRFADDAKDAARGQPNRRAWWVG